MFLWRFCGGSPTGQVIQKTGRGMVPSCRFLPRPAHRGRESGEFDPATLDAYMDKLMGTDAQKAHDDRTREELKRILEMPEEAPGDGISLALRKEDLPGIIPVVHTRRSVRMNRGFMIGMGVRCAARNSITVLEQTQGLR